MSRDAPGEQKSIQENKFFATNRTSLSHLLAELRLCPEGFLGGLRSLSLGVEPQALTALSSRAVLTVT